MSVSADLLRKARSQAGMTARELAARAAVSASTVTRVERGQMDPTVKMLMRLLEAAGAEPGTGLVKVVQMEQELADALPWPAEVITSGATHGRMAGVVNEAVPL